MRSGRRLFGLWLLCTVAHATRVEAAEPWQPFPPALTFNDFGDIGLLQNPVGRAAPDGQLSIGANRVWPYDRYYFTVQALPWVSGTLRLTTVRNRLYSPYPEFSGLQSYKDRGFDLKIRVVDETSWRPAVSVGFRDFLGTGLFSSEYLVASKRAGPLDLSLGLGWGNMASRGGIPNPFRLLGKRFDDRGSITAGGGSLNASYFKGREISLFGGVSYETPIKGLVLKAEYDGNDYQSEALSNRFRVRLPVNAGAEYAVRSWLHVGAGIERGNRLSLNLTATTNFNRPFRIPKFDPPPTPVAKIAGPEEGTAPDVAVASLERPVEADRELAPIAVWSSEPAAERAPAAPVVTASIATTADSVDRDRLAQAVADALGVQGAGLYSADFAAHDVTLYVAQSRFQNMATGLGRIARAAFSVLPPRFGAVRVVFVENGMETIAVHVYRNALIDALTPGRGSPAELLGRTDFSLPPLGLADANEIAPLGKAPPRFFYSVRPFLKTTIGRPEQFLLYQAGVRLNGFAQINRHINVQGSIALNVSDNFNKLRIPSDSGLPHVRSDIKDYLREGKTSLSNLHANYTFNIAPGLYGHVYGGLLEEMYGGFGGEVLYRPALSNWALGADLTWVKKRAFNQRFGFQDYQTITGFVTIAKHIPIANMDARVRLGRYLAKDYGGTFELSRTFDSGVTIGAFATKTNVSAADFGEGRFDKGIYVSIPLDAIYTRNVRGSVGLTYRPLIRDGGQMVTVPQPLLGTTEDTLRAKFRRDWDGIGK